MILTLGSGCWCVMEILFGHAWCTRGGMHSPASFKSELEKVILDTLEELIGDAVSCIDLHTSLEPGARSLKDLVRLHDATTVWHDASAYSMEGYKLFRNGKRRPNLDAGISLLSWLRAPHFAKSDVPATRACIICGTRQLRDAAPNQKSKMRGAEPEFFWPSEYCLNMDCFSHQIERMIDGNYRKPDCVTDDGGPLKTAFRRAVGVKDVHHNRIARVDS